MLHALESFVIPFLESLYASVGYLGVVLAMTIESCLIPLPSELILPLAGWAVARGVAEPLTRGTWDFWPAVVAGVIGNTAGSLIAYGIGTRGGRPLPLRYASLGLISAHQIPTARRP